MVTPLSVGGGLCLTVFTPQAGFCGSGSFRRCLWTLGRSLAGFALPWRRWRGLGRLSRPRVGWRWWLARLLIRPRRLSWLRRELIWELIWELSWELSWELRRELSWELRLNNGWLLNWLNKCLGFVFTSRRTTSSPFY